MTNKTLDPELIRRLELVEHPDYEGEPLTKGDYLLLSFAGIIFPFILMIWGWLV